MIPRPLITSASIVLFLLVWEFFGRGINPVFGSYPSAIACSNAARVFSRPSISGW